MPPKVPRPGFMMRPHCTRAWIDRPRLAAHLHLSPTQHVTLVQTVGWKAEEK